MTDQEAYDLIVDLVDKVVEPDNRMDPDYSTGFSDALDMLLEEARKRFPDR